MKEEHQLKPSGFNVVYRFGNLLPFVGGMVSDHLAQTISPETYYFEYHRDSQEFVPVIAGVSLIIGPLFMIGGETLTQKTVAGFAAIGYPYNLYRFLSNCTGEIYEIDHDYRTKPWTKLEKIELAGENDILEEFI